MAILIHDVPVACINHAALTYHVPAKLIISVLHTEGGRSGSATRNKNGTYDYGPMQINSSWLHQLSRYGLNANTLRYNPCLNVHVGTWILSKAIASGDTLWRGVGNYNSHTPRYNFAYQQRVNHNYSKINLLLAKA